MCDLEGVGEVVQGRWWEGVVFMEVRDFRRCMFW